MKVAWMMLYKQGALRYLNVETRLLCSLLLKFLATRLVATASIYQKISWFLFDLICVV